MKTIYFGGPWYRGVHPGLVISAMHFALQAPRHGYQVVGVQYTDGMLDLGRNIMMAAALKSGADWFLSVDADVTFDEQAQSICKALDWSGDAAIVGAPLELPDGMSNVVDLNDGVAPWQDGIALPGGQVKKIGFGLVAFRLGWYAKHWPRDKPFFQTTVIKEGESFRALGEDYSHCMAVRAMDGIIRSDAGIHAIHQMDRRVKR